MMDKRIARDKLYLLSSILFCWIYVPHIMICLLSKRIREKTREDLKAISDDYIHIDIPLWLQFLFQLHINRYYRCVFYYRIGPVLSLLIAWYRPGDKYFWLPYSTVIGGGIGFAHPYATVLNAETIGDNFHCLHCVTIGKKTPTGRRPRIGDDVTIGCNALVIGDITIGNNVTIGAGSVVIKDLPDNCVVAGNPARIIRYKVHYN